MIMGASASSVWYNLQVSHPTKEAPVIDYKLALLFQPMLMLGITIGVELSVIFPYWLITVLIIILFVGNNHCPLFPSRAAKLTLWRRTHDLFVLPREYLVVCSYTTTTCLFRVITDTRRVWCNDLFLAGTSSRSFYKGILMWREESRILVGSCNVLRRLTLNY